MKGQTYHSRISPIIWPLIWIVSLATFYITIRKVIDQPTFSFIAIFAAFWIPCFALMLTVMLGMKYLMSEEELIIKIGPFTERRISIDQIRSLKRSHNPISAPANSLKRLLIKHRDGEVLVSPSNEKEFINQLQIRNPKIKLVNLD